MDGFGWIAEWSLSSVDPTIPDIRPTPAVVFEAEAVTNETV
jgi:hypothetical protein